MIEFQIGAEQYRADKLAPLKQLKVARRLIVALGKLAHPSILPIVAALKEGKGTADISAEQVAAVLPVLIDAVQSLTDEDCEVVLMTALSVVQRKHLDTGGWQNLTTVHAGQPVFAFNDLTLPVMLQLAYKVIEDSLGSFFAAAPPGLSGQAAVAA